MSRSTTFAVTLIALLGLPCIAGSQSPVMWETPNHSGPNQQSPYSLPAHVQNAVYLQQSGSGGDRRSILLAGGGLPIPHHHAHPHPHWGVNVSPGVFYGPHHFQYGFHFGHPGYIEFGPRFSYSPPAPLVLQGHPLWIGPNPFNNSVIHEGLMENEQRWNQPLNIQPATPKTPHPVITPSTPEARLRSLRHQSHGDTWFRKHEFVKAYQSYKKAVDAAKDRAQAHFRLAYALTALGRYDRAVKEIKRGLALDPSWPTVGQTLGQFFGPDNELAKTSVLHKVAEWVREDIRDPDRLFLMGVLLHFDENAEQSASFFEAAWRLTGGRDHLQAFLQPQEPAKAGDNDQPAPGQAAPNTGVPDEENPPPAPESTSPAPESDVSLKRDAQSPAAPTVLDKLDGPIIPNIGV